jgi:G3E family GTPase
LIKEIAALAKQGKFDYLLIESTGVAEAFTFKDEHGNSLNNVSRLDTMVTVVDCVNFHKNLESVEKVIETVTKGDHEE